MDKVPGGLSVVFAKLLSTFSCMFKGIMLPGETEPFRFVARFGGVLADLVGHQSLTAWKGPNAVRCCVRCANLSNRKGLAATAPEVTLAEHDRRRFIQTTDAEIWLIVDNLAALAASGTSAAKMGKLETELGFNHEPLGILLDAPMREIYRPSVHQLNDWMHILCQDGVASAEIALYMKRMSDLRPAITNEMVRAFLGTCVLPHMHGEVDVNWVDAKRLNGDSLTAFASWVLHLVPCFAMFIDIYGVASLLPTETECFLTLAQIIGILCLGPTRSLEFVDRLELLIAAHHRLFVQSYPENLKPKLHHLHHVVDSMKQSGRLLACFVTERKHKILKKMALHTWRHYEHGVLTGVLSHQCEGMSAGHDLFLSEFLVRPKEVSGHAGLLTSTSVASPVGDLHAGDLLCTRAGVVGRALSFWRLADREILVRLDGYECHRGECSLRDDRACQNVIVQLADIVCACTWCYCREHIIKVHLPPSLLL